MDNKILLIEKNQEIIENYKNILNEHGYDTIVKNFEDTIKYDFQNYSLIIFDEICGINNIKTLQEKSQAPIIVIGNEKSSDDVCKIFDLGIDDYIDTATNTKIFLARIKAILKRNL